MELFETNLLPLRTLWKSPKDRQSVQMIIFKAIASATELSAREGEEVIAEIGRMIEVEEESKPRPDPTL